MRVVFVASDNSQSSGAFRSLVTLAQLLKNEYKVAVKVILPNQGTGSKLLEKNNIDYTIINSFDWTVELQKCHSIKSYLKWNIKKIYNRRSIKLIKQELELYKPDLVHINTSWGYVGAIAANELNIPVIWHIREFLEEDQFRKFWNRKKAYALMNRSAAIVAISQAINKKYKLIFGNKIETIPNGIDDSKYYSQHKLFIRGNNLLTVGALTPGKGHELVIKALRNLKKQGIDNFKYRIVGDGIDLHKLKELVNKENLQNNVEFCGFSENTQKYYQTSDIFILSSLSEAFGRVTIEAMMNGILVVGRNSAGTSEIINDGENGYLFNDIDELTKKLKYIFNNHDLAIQKALKGQEEALKKYTAKENANRIYKLYIKVLKK